MIFPFQSCTPTNTTIVIETSNGAKPYVPLEAAPLRGEYSFRHLVWMLAPLDTKYFTTSKWPIKEEEELSSLE